MEQVKTEGRFQLDAGRRSAMGRTAQQVRAVSVAESLITMTVKNALHDTRCLPNRFVHVAAAVRAVALRCEREARSSWTPPVITPSHKLNEKSWHVSGRGSLRTRSVCKAIDASRSHVGQCSVVRFCGQL